MFKIRPSEICEAHAETVGPLQRKTVPGAGWPAVPSGPEAPRPDELAHRFAPRYSPGREELALPGTSKL